MTGGYETNEQPADQRSEHHGFPSNTSTEAPDNNVPIIKPMELGLIEAECDAFYVASSIRIKANVPPADALVVPGWQYCPAACAAHSHRAMPHH